MAIHLAKASYPAPATKHMLLAKYTLAGVFILVTLAQLFAFEKMGTVLSAELPHSLGALVKPIAAILVVLEAAAVPSLLDVSLSPLARACSRLAGIFVWIVWYFVIYGGILSSQFVNSGLLGDKIMMPAHFLTLLLVMILFACTITVHYMDVRRVTELSSHAKNAKIRR